MKLEDAEKEVDKIMSEVDKNNSGAIDYTGNIKIIILKNKLKQ